MIDANDKSLWCCGFCRHYDPGARSFCCYVNPVFNTNVAWDYVCDSFEWFAHCLWVQQKENEAGSSNAKKMQNCQLLE